MNVHRKLLDLLLLTVAAGWVQAELAAAEAITPGQAAVGSLRGLTVAPDGLPRAGVDVVVRSLAGAPDRRLLSDQRGVFVANDLQPGQYEITAFQEGLTSARAVTVEVAQNTVTQATVGLVTDSRGQALSNKTEGQPLTDRERGLLDRIDSLEKRLAAMEAKNATEPKNDPGSEPAPGKALTASMATTSVVGGPEKPERLATAPAATEKAPEAANGIPKPVPVEVAQNQTAQSALPPTKSVEPATAVVAPPPVDNQTPFAYGDYLAQRHPSKQRRGRRHALLHSGDPVRYSLHAEF
jgi:Carboxypeptidase regulatory-like domain